VRLVPEEGGREDLGLLKAEVASRALTIISF
jgi:hypothetical protein